MRNSPAVGLHDFCPTRRAVTIFMTALFLPESAMTRKSSTSLLPVVPVILEDCGTGPSQTVAFTMSAER